MLSKPRVFLDVLAAGLWCLLTLPSFAQTYIPPVEQELPSVPAWSEQPIESQLPLPAELTSNENLPSLVGVAPNERSSGQSSMMMGPMGGAGSRNPFSSFMFLQPESDLLNQPGIMQVRGEGFSLGVPLSISSQGVWISKTQVEHLAFDSNATLPGSTQLFPEDLWNIHFGLMHLRWLENGWTAGGMLGFGSASDQPFASIREMNVNMLAFVSIPTREHDAWNLSLFYSPLGQLAFPVPGIAYAWRPSERFQMNIGIPFSLQYRPTDVISFEMSYFPLTNATALMRWMPVECWTFYGGYQTQSQAYQLANRVDDQERLFNFDQRLNLGVRRTLVAGFELDCSASYLFDRSYFRGDSFFSDGPTLRVDSGMQLMVKLEWAR